MDKFTREFVVDLPPEGVKNWDHEANKASLAQDALNAGYLVDGKVSFDGAEPHEDAVEILGRRQRQDTVLKYSAKVKRND